MVRMSLFSISIYSITGGFYSEIQLSICLTSDFFYGYHLNANSAKISRCRLSIIWERIRFLDSCVWSLFWLYLLSTPSESRLIGWSVSSSLLLVFDFERNFLYLVFYCYFADRYALKPIKIWLIYLQLQVSSCKTGESIKIVHYFEVK